MVEFPNDPWDIHWFPQAKEALELKTLNKLMKSDLDLQESQLVNEVKQQKGDDLEDEETLLRHIRVLEGLIDAGEEKRQEAARELGISMPSVREKVMQQQKEKEESERLLQKERDDMNRAPTEHERHKQGPQRYWSACAGPTDRPATRACKPPPARRFLRSLFLRSLSPHARRRRRK